MTAPPSVGRELFASYAFPPNELGYCGPPDSSVLLDGAGPAAIDRHAQGFDGAWPYLEEIAAATGCADPLDPDVVQAYWVGGPPLDRVDGRHLVHRLRTALPGQPTGLLDALDDETEVLAHHSFHVFVVYPWVRFLGTDPGHPLRILQSCRIRWGVVDAVNDDHVVITSRPVRFDEGKLALAEPVPERVRWRRDGVSLAPRPAPGQTVAAHWDWICGVLDGPGRDALAAATQSTLNLVNRLRP
ncbi:MAG: DUF6390 family protein [Mycobacterium sp.]